MRDNKLTPAEYGVQKRLVEHWDLARDCMSTLSRVADLFPYSGHQAFNDFTTNEAQQVIEVKFRDLLVVLPERATDGKAKLFVVLSGWFKFELCTVSLRTVGFGTQAAYFRRKAGSLDHVFGIHYDYDNHSIGHPAFHGQMKQYQDRDEQIGRHCPNLTEERGQNFVQPLLSNVRIPSAQMDLFSLLTQLAADHLLHEKSGSADMKVFTSLLDCEHLLGAANQVRWLSEPKAASCLRARFWYPKHDHAFNRKGERIDHTGSVVP